MQPILISNTDDNTNNAENLFIIDMAEIIKDATFKKCLILIEGEKEEQIIWANRLYKEISEPKKYYIQNRNSWELKTDIE